MANFDKTTIKDLNHYQIKTISIKLDQNNRWKKLLAVLHSMELLTTTPRDIELRSHGLNPSHCFLEYLKTLEPNFYVGILQKLALEMERNDIANFIEENRLMDKKLHKIPYPAQIRLEKLLNKNEQISYTWESFACKLGISYDVIERMNNYKHHIGSRSPTQEIFTELRCCAPALKLSTLTGELTRQGDNVIALMIENTIRDTRPFLIYKKS